MKELTNKTKAILLSDTVRGTLIVSIGTFAGSLFSYILQVALGRSLTIGDFGTFSTLLSLSIIFTLPGSAISTALVKSVSHYMAKDNYAVITRLFYQATLCSFVMGSLLALGFIVFIKPAMAYLNIKDSGLIYLFAGLRLPGVFLGMTLAILAGYIIGELLLHRDFLPKPDQTENMLAVGKSIVLFSVPALISILSLNLLNNIDVILVKHFFSDHDTGVYSGALTMAKVLLFGAGSVQIVMFPQVANAFAKGDNYISKFLKFLALQLVLLTCGLLVYLVFPSYINQIMFMGKYTSSVPLLPLFATFVALYVLANFFVLFFLALAKTKPAFFLIPWVALQVLLIYTFDHTLENVLKVNVLAAFMSLATLVGYFVYLTAKYYRGQYKGPQAPAY
ncbi:MAG: Capsular polysaccharide biosynthesis protein [candidate division WWE3 bacterium GW2011_GWA2_44_16]|uniref:Capsular polysaccharide biosynthesis protein n=1 Tax=candidate division WWE3 bacterium GW2011_GWA2_44_16 TaxID=1619110 RepID=A0A0G1JMY8_UNCKA|nr:MAG: Capsular polysaccharide biosynthesis protein [candidate division WWE3 bacterium GW2011_GWA2_44_16]